MSTDRIRQAADLLRTLARNAEPDPRVAKAIPWRSWMEKQLAEDEAAYVGALSPSLAMAVADLMDRPGAETAERVADLMLGTS